MYLFQKYEHLAFWTYYFFLHSRLSACWNIEQNNGRLCPSQPKHPLEMALACILVSLFHWYQHKYQWNKIKHVRSSPECPMTTAGSGAKPTSFRACTFIRYGTKVGVPETMYLDTFATTTDVHSSSPSFWRQLTLYWRPGPLDSKPFKG